MGNDIGNWSPAFGHDDADEDVRRSLDRIARAQDRIQRDHARLAEALAEAAPRSAARTYAGLLAVAVLAFQFLPQLMASAGLPAPMPAVWNRWAAVLLLAGLAALGLATFSRWFAERHIARAAARIGLLVEEPERLEEGAA